MLDFVGARQAPLGSKDTLSFSGPLPLVTVAFCVVDGGKQYAAWNKADVHSVHDELMTIMHGVLTQIPGGYFVRHQEGELRYMVAFDEPQVHGRSLAMACGS